MADSDARLRITAENRTKAAFDEIRQQMGRVSDAASRLSGTLTGLAGIGSLGFLAAQLKDVVSAASGLDDVAEKTGATVEELSRLSQVARISGTSFELVETSLIRLTKAIAGGDAEAQGAGRALAALGLSAEKLAALPTGEALRVIAVELNKFADGSGKSALALELLGRSGAQALPFLKDLATEQGISARVTAEQAGKAEELEKSFRRLGNSVDGLKTGLGLQMLPALQGIADAMGEAQRESGNLMAVWVALGGVAANVFGATDRQKAAARIEEINQVIETGRKQLEAGSLNPAGAKKGLFSFLVPDVELSKSQLFEIRKTIGELEKEKARLDQVLNPAKPAAPPKPVLDFKTSATGKGPGATAADKSFDNAIRQLQEEALKVQELTRFEEVLAGIQGGRYGKLTEAQQLRLQQLAAEVDLARTDAALQKEVAQIIERQREETEKLARAESDRMNAAAAGYKDLIDPVQRYRVQLDEIRKLVEKGLLTPTQGLEAEFAIQNKIEDLQQLKTEVQQASDIGRELGLTFTSTFEDIVAGSGKAGDALRALAQDVAKLLFRKTVTEPLLGTVSSALKGFDLSGFFGSLFGGARAEGGPVSAGRAYLVGERGPELFVPSASGAIAPNAGRGNTYYIDARGADAGAIARLEQRLLALNASVEQRVLAGVFDARTRGLLPG